MATSSGISQASLTATAEDLERTARDTTIAQWGVAGVVMAGSMAAGGFAFRDLGEPWPLGVVSAFAVDLALAAWLRIAARLRALGITAPMGWVLELTAAAMTLFLNIGAALFPSIHPTSPTARGLLAVAHSFLPIVLVLVTMAGSQAQLSLLTLRRETDARQRAEALARLATDRARQHAERQRITADRDADTEGEITDRREERAHAERHLIASLASMLALGAAWRTRPAPRPSPRSPRPIQARPRRVPPSRSRPTPVAVPVTKELLSQARRVAAQRASQGKTAGRAVLQRELQVPETTARELARRLGTTPTTDAPHPTTTPTEPEGKAA